MAVKSSQNVGFNTQPPKGGWQRVMRGLYACSFSFNTQPPKGGWKLLANRTAHILSFNTQPPKGGWNPNGGVVGSN